MGYKTKHKKRAFELIDHMAANFGIHHQVIMRARQEFSRYRDVRETIQQFEGVVAACIVIAFREIMSSAGIEGVQAKKVAYKSQEEPLSAFKTHVLDDEAGLGPDSTIGRWTTEEMKRWLECMLGGSASPDTDAFIRFICAHVDKKLTEQNDDSSRKRKYPEMKKLIGFGTTTIESRKNILERTLRPPTGAKSAATTARAAQQTEKRAGQLLLNLDIATLHDEYLQSKSTSGNGSAENADEEKSKDVDLVRTLRSAIHRRVQFEAARTVSRHEAELEATRLLTERANGVLSVQSVTDNGKLTSDSGSGSFDRHHYMTEPVTSAVSSSNNSGAANQLTSSTKKRKMEAVGPAFSLPAEVVDMDSLFEMSSDIVAAAEKIQERQIKVEPKQPVSSVPKPKSRFKVVRQRSGDSAVNIGMDSEAVVVSAAQKEKESDIQQSAPTGSTHPSQVGQQLSREAMAAMLQFKQQRAAAAAAAAATNGQR